ncbi:ribonucleotide-diphosphate reductase subunit beta [Actinobacillus equuli]|nr:ribonucleotide-diphosphate reductase subunit beta [Actinobacillus equuli]
MLNIMASGQDDPEMAQIAEECKQEAYELFVAAAEQEKNGRRIYSKTVQ